MPGRQARGRWKDGGEGGRPWTAQAQTGGSPPGLAPDRPPGDGARSPSWPDFRRAAGWLRSLTACRCRCRRAATTARRRQAAMLLFVHLRRPYGNNCWRRLLASWQRPDSPVDTAQPRMAGLPATRWPAAEPSAAGFLGWLDWRENGSWKQSPLPGQTYERQGHRHFCQVL